MPHLKTPMGIGELAEYQCCNITRPTVVISPCCRCWELVDPESHRSIQFRYRRAMHNTHSSALPRTSAVPNPFELVAITAPATFIMCIAKKQNAARTSRFTSGELLVDV
jgi:hypothetical protein